MIEERNKIPLEELDKDVSKGKYLLVKTGGYHPFYEVKQALEKYRQNIWPWIKKIGGNLQHKKKLGKINGSISVKKPYINYTVEKNVDVFGYDKKGRPNRKKSYFHLIIGKAFVSNPRGLIHQTDGGDGVIDHINNHPIDYRIENLQWLTRSENSTGYPKRQRKTRKEIYLHMKKQGWAD